MVGVGKAHCYPKDGVENELVVDGNVLARLRSDEVGRVPVLVLHPRIESSNLGDVFMLKRPGGSNSRQPPPRAGDVLAINSRRAERQCVWDGGPMLVQRHAGSQLVDRQYQQGSKFGSR